MKQILFLAPYPEMRATIEAVLQSYPQRDEIAPRIAVTSVDGVDGVDIRTCDAIVARGYSARRLKAEKLDVPVAEIQVEGYDVITSVQECRKRFHPRSIAFVGFYNAFNGIKRFEEIFDCGINVYIPRNVNDLDNVMRRIRDDGCDAVIGGFSVHQCALAHGFPSIGLRSGEDAVGHALEEAVRSIDMLRRERIRSETYRLITQSVKNGIVYVDEDGVIQVENSAARSLAHCELTARRLEDVLPFMAEPYRKSLSQARAVTGECRRGSGQTLSLDCRPVVVHGGVSGGVVISFQHRQKEPATGDGRGKLRNRGLMARYRFEDIVHAGPEIAEVIDIARRFAVLSPNILVAGETGTGKELFAQSIHNESLRRNGPFVAVNCAALPENLLESELFGYVDGAFTGSTRGGRPGLFELADQGTLFLDEISEMPPSVQSKLLRVLQEGEVRRIGDGKVVPVDVRILSATNTDLYALAERGLFRHDLLYRLDVLDLWLPPLRKRRGDMIPLFDFFLKCCCRRESMVLPRVEDAVLDLLRAQEFPGNVRELKNTVERACALCRDPGRITAEDVALALRRSWGDRRRSPSQVPAEKPAPIGDGRAETLRILDEAHGNRAETARRLGIDRTTLWRRLRKYREN